jgi:hypothetical protein
VRVLIIAVDAFGMRRFLLLLRKRPIAAAAALAAAKKKTKIKICVD